jgi:hypothetical protein
MSLEAFPPWRVDLTGPHVLMFEASRRRRLLLLLLLLLLLALLLSAVYSVPSVWRVILYFLAFLGPSILFATGALTLASGFARTLLVQLITAFARSMIGLVAGFIVVVYMLRVW